MTQSMVTKCAIDAGSKRSGSGGISGFQLRMLRRTLGIDQISFAAKIGVTQATVSKWERGISTIDEAHAQNISGEFELNNKFDISKDPLVEADFEDKWADLLRFYRITRSLTQEQMAELLDVDVTTIFRWEHGLFPPGLSQQRRIRDLLLKPLDNSAQFNKIRNLVGHSRSNMFISIERILLGFSKPMLQMNNRHGFNISAFSDTAKFFDGKLDTYMSERTAAGFFRGAVHRTSFVVSLSQNHARRVVSYPLSIENGPVLVVGFHRTVDPELGARMNGKFEILHADETVQQYG